MKIKLVIFGSGELASEIAIQSINSNYFELVGVITSGEQIVEVPKELIFCNQNEIYNLCPDISIAIDYHKIIDERIVKKFKIINSHGGLLPHYRGYHGLGWSFINGEHEIGYTLHLMDELLDNGNIIYQFKKEINDKTTFGELKGEINKDLRKNILQVVKSFVLNKKVAYPQKEEYPIYVAKRNVFDCFITWDLSSIHINRLIRALNYESSLKAFTIYKSKKLYILNSEVYKCKPYYEVPGHVLLIKDEKALVKTGDSAIWIEDVIYDGQISKAGWLFKTQGARLGVNLVEMFLKEKNII